MLISPRNALVMVRFAVAVVPFLFNRGEADGHLIDQAGADTGQRFLPEWRLVVWLERVPQADAVGPDGQAFVRDASQRSARVVRPCGGLQCGPVHCGIENQKRVYREISVTWHNFDCNG